MTFKPLHILLDVDGTFLSWGGRWDEIHSQHFSSYTNIPLSAVQTDFNLKLGLNEEEQGIVDQMFNFPGFYKDLEPFEGAVEAYRKMIEAGHHVQFVTSPWWSNPTCLQDKSESILKYFGEDAQRTAVYTSDKTSVRGDFLFDDKPKITGHYTERGQRPTWQQILFDQPYNQKVDLPRIHSWVGDEWERTIKSYFYDRILTGDYYDD